MAEITEGAVSGAMFLSCLAGLGGGLLSLTVLPWYAAIGAGICALLFVFFWLSILMCIKTPNE